MLHQLVEHGLARFQLSTCVLLAVMLPLGEPNLWETLPNELKCEIDTYARDSQISS
jgi:hypothetical protein